MENKFYKSDFYRLKNVYEKESVCYEQKVSKNFPVYKISVDYKNEDHNMDTPDDKTKFFLNYLNGKSLPERPKGSGNTGFYFKNEDFVAFKGLGKEMSLFFHVIIIPTLKHGCDNGNVILRSVKDIKKEHIQLLLNMKKEFIKFIKRNKRWFYLVYNFNGMETWLNPDNFQFGFHWPPTVGYLHMHAMVGPVTEHGESMKNRWVSLDQVIEDVTKA